MPTTKRRALILISSGRQLPLVAPAEVKSISTGFFLVEMAQVLKEFENDYEFTFATPDGNAPQLDINGMALSVHSIEQTGFKTLPMRMQQRRPSNDVTISLNCHAPIAVNSTRQRIDAQGAAQSVKDNPVLAAPISTVPKNGELFAQRFLYPRAPGKRARLPYFVDGAIKEAGFALV